MWCAESRVRGQQGDIPRFQAVNRFLVSVKPQKPALVGNIDLVTECPGEGFVRLIQAILTQIRHGHQFDRPAGAAILGTLRSAAVTQHQATGRHRVSHGTITPAAATDQRQLNGVVSGRVNMGNGNARQG